VSTRAAASPAKRKRNAAKRPAKFSNRSTQSISNWPLLFFTGFALLAVGWVVHQRYTLSLQSPFRLSLHWPVVVTERTLSESAASAQADQNGRGLSAWQQYACQKFGSDCRLALAIQRAENPQGKCEIYHYNSNGTLDWGYFQINTVHLERPGLNLRDLLDCKANIDFAYQLYQEKGGFSAWSTFKNGRYRQFMTQQ
jgi:hypothetical protein